MPEHLLVLSAIFPFTSIRTDIYLKTLVTDVQEYRYWGNSLDVLQRWRTATTVLVRHVTVAYAQSRIAYRNSTPVIPINFPQQNPNKHEISELHPSWHCCPVSPSLPLSSRVFFLFPFCWKIPLSHNPPTSRSAAGPERNPAKAPHSRDVFQSSPDEGGASVPAPGSRTLRCDAADGDDGRCFVDARASPPKGMH